MPKAPDWPSTARPPVIALLDTGVRSHPWLLPDESAFLVDAEKEYGWPSPVPDHDPGPIGNYKGINDTLGGPHLTGAYGGFWVIRRLFEAGLIGMGWQPGGHPDGAVTPKLPATQVWHTVKPGDTLSALAAAYG
ncbi:MAG TPA: LysM domain-containing protein, partial [Streptosporangiaceae bacterium]|nr:LysM domain-containing protein [Streptosporangiaceae bacterium]